MAWYEGKKGGGGDSVLDAFFSATSYSSTYVQSGVYLNGNNEVSQFRFNDAQGTLDFGKVGTLTVRYTARGNARITVNVPGTLYTNNNGTVTSQHLNANDAVTVSYTTGAYIPSIHHWFIKD